MPMPNLGFAVLLEIELGDQLFRERAAHAFADQRIFAEQFHAASEIRAGLAVLLDAHVAGGDTDDGALVVVENFGGGKARIDLDAQGFRVARQPATDIAERDDVVAVIAHQRRHGEVRQADGTGRAEQQEVVVLDLGLERMICLFAPIRQQAVDTNRIDDGARQDMRTDFGALLQHDDGEFGIDLLQPDRGREAGRTAADNHDVEFHALAFGQFSRFGHSSFSARPALRP